MLKMKRQQVRITKSAGKSRPLVVHLSIGVTIWLILLGTNGKQQQASAATSARAQPNSAQQQHSTSHVFEPSNTRLNYFGSFIGKLNDRSSHAVSGQVYAVDEQTLFIKNFNYDGRAADVYFWSSTSSLGPSADGAFIVPDEKGSTKPLERYINKDIVLRLPEGKTLREINWLSIWSRQMKQSLADIIIPRSSSSLLIPRPLEIAPLTQLAHGTRSGPITIVDAQTLLVPELYYDGLGPDAYFWLSRAGSVAGLHAGAHNSIRLKDENGSTQALRKYNGETIVISLPDEITVYDFDYFGIWCRQYSVDFGHTKLPRLLAATTNTGTTTKVPPSPKMLGIRPENKLNCEILYDELGFEIRWVLDGDDIVMQLVGKIEPGEYMAFGLGKDDSRSDMNNADAVVVWVDRSSSNGGQVHAVDYYLGSAKAQCVNDPKRGACPDIKLPGGADSLTLLHGAIVNGYSMVTFKRPQLGVDELYDQHVYSDGQQSVIWAVGALNGQNEIGYHRLRTKSNMFIDFARHPQWNCPVPDVNASMHSASHSAPAAAAAAAAHANGPQQPAMISSAASQLDQTVVAQQAGSTGLASSVQQQTPFVQSNNNEQQNEPAKSAAWFVPSIVCPNERIFYAQIGPAGGVRRGLASLTPNAWYINGLLAPELVVERGQAYKFVVEGGNDKTVPSLRHPLYLTDSNEGGFNFKTDDERQRERLFGGVALRTTDGQFVPTAEGRMCEWRPSEQTAQDPDVYKTFSAFQRTLSLNCAPGQASVLKFVPDSSTPNELFYQCYTNRFMGGRIRVVDSCAKFTASNGLGASALAGTGQRSNKRNTQLNRRQSPAQPSELVAQASEARMSFEMPQMGEMSLGMDSAVGDFGDQFAVSNGAPNELIAALGPSGLILNNSQLSNGQPTLNLSSLEQILKYSPNDLELLDANDAQALAMMNLNAQQQHQHQPIQQMNFDIQQQIQQLQQMQSSQLMKNSTTTLVNSQPGAKNNSRPPRAWSAYIRRLASIYYPVQQQLASMLSTSQPHNNNNSNNNNLQQTAMHNGANNIKQQPTDVVASASSVSSFSLANLVSKSPKIVAGGLSKANIGKKFNKLRIKSGRKIEPNQQSNSANGQATRPPTPENESNYDIFNNQLAQIEHQQRQLQAMENMAAVAAAAAAMPIAHMQPMQAPSDQSSFNYIQPAAGVDGGELGPASLFELSNNFQHQHQQQQQQQHHNQYPIYQETLQQQQSSPSGQQHATQYIQRPPGVDSFNNNHTRWPSNEEHAVFITRLTSPNQSQQQQQLVADQQWMNNLRQNQAPNQHQMYHADGATTTTNGAFQMAPPSSIIVSLEGETMSNELAETAHPQEELSRPPQNKQRQQTMFNGVQQKQTPRDPLDSSTTTTSTTSSASNSNNNNNELDHMLAIERYSKQYSERRTPATNPSGNEMIQSDSEHELQQQQQFRPQIVTNQSSDVGLVGSHVEQSHQQPKLFSSILIDRHIVAPQAPMQPALDSAARAGQMEIEKSAQAGNDMRRANDSVIVMASQEASSFVMRDNKNSAQFGTHQQQQQQASSNNNSQPITQTTEASALISPVLIRPNPISVDFFASEPSATGIMAAGQPGSSHFFSTTQPSVGPLVPSAGPPINTQQQQQQTDESSTVFRTNLIEPITSTLVPVTHHQQQSQDSARLATSQTDTSPFRPIELMASASSHQQQQQQQQNQNNPYLRHISDHRLLRPPTLVETMLSSYAAPNRPEPPVQVASYLAQHMVAQLQNNQQINENHTQRPRLLVSSDRSSLSPIHQQVSLGADMTAADASSTSTTTATLTSQQHQEQQQQPNTSRPIDLIILKPALIHQNQQQSHQNSNTYMLKPEFLTTTTNEHNNNNNPFRPIFSKQKLNSADSFNMDQPAGDVHATDNDSASRRLAGQLFERLSSLSSPPSTSMVLDHALITSNSINTSKFNNNKHIHHEQTSKQQQQPGNGDTSLENNLKATNNNNITSVADDVRQQQTIPTTTIYGQQPRHIPGTLIASDGPKFGAQPSSMERVADLQMDATNNRASSSASLPSASSNNNFNLLYKDNSTDNAILSHVMSLISSNAIPAPLLPVNSYSSADYFLPISDHHHHPHRVQIRRRSTAAATIRKN